MASERAYPRTAKVRQSLFTALAIWKALASLKPGLVLHLDSRIGESIRESIRRISRCSDSLSRPVAGRETYKCMPREVLMHCSIRRLVRCIFVI